MGRSEVRQIVGSALTNDKLYDALIGFCAELKEIKVEDLDKQSKDLLGSIAEFWLARGYRAALSEIQAISKELRNKALNG